MNIDLQQIKLKNLLISILSILFIITVLIPFLTGSNPQLGYTIGGLLSIIMLILGFSLLPVFMSKKAQLVERKVRRVLEKVAITDITPLGPLRDMKPVTLRLKVRNPLDTFGVRLRFRSFDYFNPTNLHLPLAPGEEESVDVVFIPTGSGEREFSVAIAPLYNEDNLLIPEDEADDVDVQEFSIEVEETVAGGLSSRERSILSGLIKFATFLSASGLIYFSILRVSGLEALIFVLTQVVPIITVLQVPALMLYFYLEGKLPEKPSFKFEESE